MKQVCCSLQKSIQRGCRSSSYLEQMKEPMSGPFFLVLKTDRNMMWSGVAYLQIARETAPSQAALHPDLALTRSQPNCCIQHLCKVQF